ncbi:MAG: hypothetical protein HFI51_06790 [Lachnospiraceae bacterium]|nr:hypothetical protein [Lachnospiraceae bacterium]
MDSEKKKRKKGIGILPKMVLMCSLPMVILEVIITLYSMNALQDGMQSEAFNGLGDLCQAVEAAYDAVDSGEYHMEGELLYKGEYCVTENVDVIDSFTKDSDVSVTLFYGDTRGATSLIDKETGKRIVGTKASDAVISAVLQKGEVYQTDSIVVNGENYYAYYKPVEDDSGNIVGMVFAGRPSKDVDAIIIKETSSVAVIAVIILLISIVICALLVKGIVRVVVHAEGLLEGIAGGRLKIQLSGGAAKLGEAARKRTDEIGLMINSMYDLVEKLQSMVLNIKTSTENLMRSGDSLESMASQTSTTADEISQAVEDISKGAVTQAEDIETATAQVAGIGEMIENIVSGVKELDEISLGIKKADDESEKIISELSVSNDRTNEAIRKIGASVRTTNESVGRIQEAINLITAIASETSLLSLNASIEAARAGEAGRGFAVVASQISKLSEDSNSSAKTIENIIVQLAADSEASVRIMDEVGEIIREQKRKLDETRDKFKDVSRGIETSMSETEKIYAQTKECDQARVRVTDIVQNLSAVAQQNAASTEETNAAMQELNATINLLAEAAKDLKEIADELEKDVSFFQV